MKAFDVIVVGGSIAGLYAGMKLARAGMNVCIIDRKHMIGVPVRCGEATGNIMELSRFFEPRPSWVAREFAGFALHVNDSPSIMREIRDAGVVLHRDRLEQDLAEKAREFGASVLLDTVVTGLHDNPRKKWDGVIIEDGTMLEGRYIIGADGCESKVGQWAGITGPLALDEAASSIEYHADSDFCNDGFLHFFMGSSIIMPGYIWVFPKGENHGLVGGCLYGCPGDVPKVKYFVDEFIKNRMPGARTHSMITGCVPVTLCPRELTKRNVLVIGDAARQSNPLSAGGIMNALEAADLAANAVLGCNGDEQKLTAYSRQWSQNQRRQQKFFRLLRDIVVNSSDAEIIALARTAARVFKAGVDRSKPFTLPVTQLCVLIMKVLPKAFRYCRALAG